MKRRKRMLKALPAIDTGPKERARHGRVVLEPIMMGFKGDQVAGHRAREKDECVLDRYWHRCLLIERLYAAGMKLRPLWLRANYPRATTSAYGEMRGSGDGEAALVARERLRRVLIEAGLATHARDEAPVVVMGASGERAWPVQLPLRLTQEGHVVISVCGLDEWAGGTRRLMRLRDGLTALADYWKIEG